MGEFNLDKYFRSRLKEHSEDIDTDDLWAALDLESDDDERGILFWLKGLLPLLLIAMAVLFYSNHNSNSNDSQISSVDNTTIDRAEPVSNSEKTNNNNNNNKQKELQQNTIEDTAENKSLNPNQLTLANSEQHNLEQQPLVTSKASKSSKESTISSARIVIPQFSKLGPIPLTELESRRKLKLIPEQAFSQKAIEPLKNKKSQNLSLDLYSGYYLLQRNLESIRENENLVSSRNASEQALEMISLGIDLKYQLHNGIYFKSGLEFQSINERFSYAYSRQDTIEVDYVPVTNYVGTSGDTITETGLGLAKQQVDVDGISYNNHHLLSIPFSVGYTQEWDAWSLFAEGSCAVSLAHSFSGKQLDRQLQVSDDPVYFSYGTKVGLGASIGIGYKLNSKLQLTAQPRYQTLLSSFTSKASGMRQTYKMYGIRIGLNYDLN